MPVMRRSQPLGKGRFSPTCPPPTALSEASAPPSPGSWTSKERNSGTGCEGTKLGEGLRGIAAVSAIVGRGGADRIEGAGGADLLTGGAGPDPFVYTAA